MTAAAGGGESGTAVASPFPAAADAENVPCERV